MLLALTAPFCAAQVPSRAPAWQPPETTYDAPFFPGATYDPAIPTPETILGRPLGTRPASHAELERCLNAWRAAKRVTVHSYAKSHEQRALYYAVITTAANQAWIEGIRAGIGKLADPRKLQDHAEAEYLINAAPAIAWMAYSIHGDELSSTDAAIALIYHLIASQDASVEELLREVVVIVDPLMNPDGRERILSQLGQYGGYTPNLDAEALQHAGRWPYGRGNHYLFDLNRDWILGVHPESRGRQRALVAWNPQLFVDSHEMGAYDTYLFNPPREPINPYMSGIVRKWWGPFTADQAAAFDAHGWSYYTREWLELWYPGYSDTWAAFRGAIGILYEQAGVGGSPIRQRAGNILTYRESVHHHIVSSMANIRTLRDNRKAILTDFLQRARDALAVEDESKQRAFVVPPGANPTRARAFLNLLHNQGIAIDVATEAFTAPKALDMFRETSENREFPAGTYIVQLAQPAADLIATMLEFDPRMTDEALKLERDHLEAKRESKIYDVTGWSLPMAYAIDGYWCAGPLRVATTPYQPAPEPAGAVDPGDRIYAYVIDGADDSVFRAAAHLLQHGVQVRVAEKDFRLRGRAFTRGSLLIRAHENDENLAGRIERAAEATRTHIYTAQSGLSADDGPDLGGGHFILLQRPRVALFGDSPVNFTSYGAIWRLFDVDVGLAVSLLSVNEEHDDLRRYNVIMLPRIWGDAAAAYGSMVEPLETWVRAGGTLIAVGNAAQPFTDPNEGFSAVRRRQDVLAKLPEYAYAVRLERLRGKTKIDPDNIWGALTETQPAEPPEESPDEDAKAEHLDEWRRVFMPSGLILRGMCDREHWLTFGSGVELPVFFSGSTVLMSKHPVQTPVRLAAKRRLRLSGLLWPEAAERIANGAYATVERLGHGQVILFAAEPDFRGYWHGTRRLLINAVLLGPGCGTSQPTPAP